MARAMMTRIVLSIVATTMLFELALGADHNVGAPGGGWDTSTDLGSWASSETFTVGDNLVFTYTSTHDVLEVSKANYDSCSLSSPISTNTVSPTTFELTDAGSRYFICGTPGHCDQGMKVEIKTVAATSAPPTTTTPPPSDSPAPPTTTTPPPSDSPAPPTTTTPPSSDSPAPPTSTTSPPSSDSPAPPASTTSPPSSGTPAVLTPSSATTMKMSALSMVGVGFLMMI